MSVDWILTIARRNLQYAKMHVEDIDDAHMCDQPSGLVNHPAWIIGHIVGGMEMLASVLGLPANMPAEYKALFGWGSVPTPDRSRYPSKKKLLEAMESSHTRLVEFIAKAPAELLARENPVERMRSMVPTIGDGVASILAGHTAIHLGQLSAWRLAMGMGLKA